MLVIIQQLPRDPNVGWDLVRLYVHSMLSRLLLWRWQPWLAETYRRLTNVWRACKVCFRKLICTFSANKNIWSLIALLPPLFPATVLTFVKPSFLLISVRSCIISHPAKTASISQTLQMCSLQDLASAWGGDDYGLLTNYPDVITIKLPSLVTEL